MNSTSHVPSYIVYWYTDAATSLQSRPEQAEQLVSCLYVRTAVASASALRDHAPTGLLSTDIVPWPGVSFFFFSFDFFFPFFDFSLFRRIYSRRACRIQYQVPGIYPVWWDVIAFSTSAYCITTQYLCVVVLWPHRASSGQQLLECVSCFPSINLENRSPALGTNQSNFK